MSALTLLGLAAAAAAALGLWYFRPEGRPLDNLDMDSPFTGIPGSWPQTPRRGGIRRNGAHPRKRTVAFDLDQNTTKEVSRWFTKEFKHRRRGWKVTFDAEYILEVDRWLSPQGHRQFSFPVTTWPRNLPSFIGQEDEDGDLAMD
jgi:hypothetical protein